MRVYLKVKLVNLADEARTIRRLERARKKAARYAKEKNLPWYNQACTEFWGLKEHRIGIVRREARDSHLAYGFLKGTPYERMEAKCYTQPNWDNAKAIAARFCPPDEKSGFDYRWQCWREKKKPTAVGKLIDKVTLSR